VKRIVDISDGKVSDQVEDELITYSLGSCIGVAVYDKTSKVGGMLHFQLPSSRLNSPEQKRSPYMFADTGMKELLKNIEGLGGNKKKVTVKIAGGAQMMNDAKMFNIGKRNYTAIRQFLWKNGLFIDQEDIGGKNPRNLYLRMKDGQVHVRSQGETTLL